MLKNLVAMKFRFLSAVVGIVFAGCSMENDMMVPKDVAGYEIFEIEGQVSSSINTSKLTVTVTMPADTSLSALTISKIKYTDVTKGLENLYSKGYVLDLSSPLKVKLHSFRDYEWTITAVNADKDAPVTGPQLYNMSFDNWAMVGKGWYPYGEDASDSDKAIWATANKGTAALGRNTTTPETSFLAVEGSGKSAAKLSSEYIMVKFASGNIFTGEFCGLKGMSGADLAWGVPFTGRPKSLHGYYCYQPVLIDNTDEAHKDLKGTMDVGQIQVILADWDKNKWSGYPSGAIDSQGRFHVINSDGQFIDFDNDPAIIGYGNFEFNEYMDAYKEFDLTINYKNDRTPSVVAIVSASSRYGDYFTGGKGTVLYLDEFSFVY